MSCKVRFAPSPTGFMHIGNARIAIINYLFCKKNNGKLLLRIDDTDVLRSRKECEDAIMNDLSAHGVFVRITSTQLCMLIKGTMQQDSKVITLESRGVLAETGTLRDEALAMLGGGQANV